MKKYYQIANGFLFCLCIAGFAYLWAVKLMESLYKYRSPFSNTPLPPGNSTDPSITSKVVIILIDALRVDTANNSKIMLFTNNLKSNSAWGIMHSQTPSYSEPGWTTILTGAWPELSDGPVLNLDYENIYPFTQDNIFSAAHRHGFATAISGFYWFEKLLPPGSVDKGFYTEGEDDLADQEVLSAAMPWLRDNGISLILIHIDQVDYAGHHQGGPRSNYWDEAATRADTMVSAIVSELDLKQDTVVILSDHGQIDAGGHGGQENIVLSEPFIFSGKSIITGNYPDIQMVDIAPTIAVALGLNIPAVNQDRPLIEMLIMNAEKLSLVNSAIANQQIELLNAYSKPINQKVIQSGDDGINPTENSILKIRNTRLKVEIFNRALIAMVLLGIILYLIFNFLKIKTIYCYLIYGIIYILLFNFRNFLLDNHPYSLSWINSQNDLVQYIAVTTTISYLISWLSYAIINKTILQSQQEIIRNSLFLTISTIFLVAFPVYISYVINGPLVSWTLPDMLSMYLAFLSLLQCMIIAIVGMALSVFSFPILKVVRKIAGVNFN